MKFKEGDTVKIIGIKPGTIDNEITRSYVGTTQTIVHLLPLGDRYSLRGIPEYVWHTEELQFVSHKVSLTKAIHRIVERIVEHLNWPSYNDTVKELQPELEQAFLNAGWKKP